MYKYLHSKYLWDVAKTKMSVPHFFIRIASVFLFASLLSGCAKSHVATELAKSPELSFPIMISVQPCIDRTETQVTDLGLQATETFQKELKATEEFSVVTSGRYILNCEVTSFLPGNAVKRWVLPGWGTTVGQVAAMMQDSKTGEILIILEGNATVGSGGLYSIGAWSYIIPTAVKDIVSQLQSWAGKASGTDDVKIN
jgi:hypothetical protein